MRRRDALGWGRPWHRVRNRKKARKMKEYQKVLCIAGSECLGSSGVQADLKAISACGAFGAGALTCLVNMSTTKVKDIMPLPEDFVTSSIRSFLDDVKADAIKTGMLFAKPLIDRIGSTLLDYPEIPKVVDPVMVAATGDRLIELEAIEAYKESMFPVATLITPNFKEACLLLGHEFGKEDLQADMDYLCRWGNAAIVKSFHQDGKFMDVFSSGQGQPLRLFEKRFIETKNVNGTGCTFSSSIAAFIARGFVLEEAVAHAEDYIGKAIEEGSKYHFGAGNGPVCHFYNEMPL